MSLPFETRQVHMLSVGRYMKVLSKIKGWSIERQQEMLVLGMLHDIGYELNPKTDDHAKIGGEFLKSQGYTYWREIYHHGKADCEYKSEELDLLNTADLTIGPFGNNVGVQERLFDIQSRYGVDSESYINSRKLAIELGLIEDGKDG